MPHPDADLYPEATGLAKTLVDKHRESQPLKLYAGWFCPFGLAIINQIKVPQHRFCIVQRVWAVLEEKEIPYQYISLYVDRKYG